MLWSWSIAFSLCCLAFELIICYQVGTPLLSIIWTKEWNSLFWNKHFLVILITRHLFAQSFANQSTHIHLSFRRSTFNCIKTVIVTVTWACTVCLSTIYFYRFFQVVQNIDRIQSTYVQQTSYKWFSGDPCSNYVCLLLNCSFFNFYFLWKYDTINIFIININMINIYEISPVDFICTGASSFWFYVISYHLNAKCFW